MPTSIPYDPSLALGNIVSLEKLDNLQQIATAQAPVNAAQKKLDALMKMKRSLDATMQDMSNMGVDISAIVQESQKVGQNIQQAGIEFAQAKIESEQKILPIESKISTISESIESPIDYQRSQLKSMPLSADSLTMDCQYFAFDKESQSSASQASAISSYHSLTHIYNYSSYTEKDTNTSRQSVQQQVHSQYESHDIAGTLVFSINCTHKDALVFAPYFIDVDKAIRVWNDMFPKDELNVMNPTSIMEAFENKNTETNNIFNLLSGATFGSSFVGMVHILNNKSSASIQSMQSLASTLQAQEWGGSWLANSGGGWGMDKSFSNSAKSLLSNQNISSHCTMSVMGSIPSLKANSVKMAVEQFSNFSGASAMQDLANLQNATASAQDTMESAANSARTGAQLVNLGTTKIKPTLDALSESDKEQNKIIDTNSMIDAMEDYINKCLSGNVGVPINYYLKPIKKAELAEAYIRKYFPSKFDVGMSTGDDSTDKTTATTKS